MLAQIGHVGLATWIIHWWQWSPASPPLRLALLAGCMHLSLHVCSRWATPTLVTAGARYTLPGELTSCEQRPAADGASSPSHTHWPLLTLTSPPPSKVTTHLFLPPIPTLVRLSNTVGLSAWEDSNIAQLKHWRNSTTIKFHTCSSLSLWINLIHV